MEVINLLLPIALAFGFTSSAPIRYNNMDYRVNKMTNGIEYNEKVTEFVKSGIKSLNERLENYGKLLRSEGRENKTCFLA